jgi:hypothetical protein
MKVNILPSILKGGGGRDKGGTEKEGGQTGRGDRQGGGKDREGGHTGRGERQGGRTYREGGKTGREDIQGGGKDREGGHTGSGGWVVSVCGCSLSAGAHYSRAGVVVVRGGGSSSSVGTAMPVVCRRGVVGVAWGVFGARCSWWGRRCLRRVTVDAWGVVVVHGIRGRSPLCVRGVVVCPCMHGHRIIVRGWSSWVEGGRCCRVCG